MKFKLLITHLLIFLISCTERKENDLLLQIGKYELRKDDYEILRSSPANSDLSAQELHNKIIEEGRMIAYALGYQYDTIKVLNKQLEYILRAYASKVDGYVWNKKVKPVLGISEEDVQEAYQKRSMEYHMDVLHFPNQNLLKRYIDSDLIIKSPKEFDLLKGRVGQDTDVKCYTAFLRFPFFPFGEGMGNIDKASIGDAWGPFETLYGFYIVNLKAIKRIFPKPYEQEKSMIKQELLQCLNQKYIWESQQKIFLETKPRINQEAIEEMISKFNVLKKKWPGMDKNSVLMKYRFNGKDCSYTMSDFEDFVNFQPIFTGSLTDVSDIKKMLKTFLINIYLFDEAKKMGMEEDKEYWTLKKRYQYNTYLQYYKKQFVYPSLTVESNEIEQYYNENNNKFHCFESASISIFKFEDIQKAFKGRQVILKNNKALSDNDFGETEELPFSETLEVQVNDNNVSPELIAALMNLKSGTVSTPIKIDGQFYVISMDSVRGSIIKPLKFVQDEIKQTLLNKKEKYMYAQIDTELSAQYPIRLNLLGDYKNKKKL